MALALTSTAGNYHLLYYQPSPEDGERICVGILASKGRDIELLYDPAFPKLRCIAPEIRPDLVKVYLEDMQEELRRQPIDDQLVFRRYSPQFAVSEQRQIKWPLTDSAKRYLIDRFLHATRSQVYALSEIGHAAASKADDQAQHGIQEFVRQFTPTDSRIILNAAARDVVGLPLKGVRRVALAVRKPSETLLVDGVDLRITTANGAISRVTRVVHTFWQYGRYQQESIGWNRIRRIGVVLNGAAHPPASYRDAHDFALDQFRTGADISIDAASAEDRQKFEALFV